MVFPPRFPVAANLWFVILFFFMFASKRNSVPLYSLLLNLFCHSNHMKSSSIALLETRRQCSADLNYFFRKCAAEIQVSQEAKKRNNHRENRQTGEHPVKQSENTCNELAHQRSMWFPAARILQWVPQGTSERVADCSRCDGIYWAAGIFSPALGAFFV